MQENPERIITLTRTLARELKPGARDFDRLGLDYRLESDFGIDSLARVELISRINHELGVELGEAALAAETPRDLLRLITATPQPATMETTAAPREPGFEAASESLQTITGLLDWHAEHQGSRVHITLLSEDGGARDITYAQLRDAARALAYGLKARGLAPGSRVALMLPTGLDFFAAFYGTLYAGCVPVPLYPPARPAQLEEHMRRLAGILNNAGAAWFLTDPRAITLARVLRAQCPSLAGISTVADISLASTMPLPEIDAQALAFIQYTSGSTGDPKGVSLTHANLVANIRAMQQASGVTEQDVFVSWLPLYHDMGLIGAVLGSMAAGFHLVLMSPLAFLSQPLRWLRAIDRYRATISAAPNFAYEICANKLQDRELEGLDLSCWRLAFNGAEPVSPVTIVRFAKRLAPCGFRASAMTPVYGLAECSVGLCFPPPGRGTRIDTVDRRALRDVGEARPVAEDAPDMQHVVSCGIPLPGHAVRIVDAEGRVLSERKAGRIQFRGPSATAGYFNHPAATAKLFDGEWLNTGDLGYFAEGELFITGREKDIIIRGGHNIHPQELEEAIGRIAGVRPGGVAVFPASDARSGTEKLVVLAETRAPVRADNSHIRKQIEELALTLIGMPVDDVVLAPPRTVLKTSSGKIRRASCRTAYESGRLQTKARAPWQQMLRLALSAFTSRAQFMSRSLPGALWGAWAWAVFAALSPPFWLLIASLPGLSNRRRAARLGARLVLVFTGARPRIEGLERIPPDGPLAVVANHASYLDGLILTAVLPPCFAYVAKAELLANPFAAIPLKRLGSAFVERFDPTRGAEDTGAIEARLAAGESLVFFAEGTFRELPGLLPFRMGAFLAAARTGAPVLPITLAGTRTLLPGRRKWPRRARLEITIGKSFRPTGNDWNAALSVRDAARAEILERLGEPDAATLS